MKEWKWPDPDDYDPIADLKALDEKARNDIGLLPENEMAKTLDERLTVLANRWRLLVNRWRLIEEGINPYPVRNGNLTVIYDEQMGHHRLDPYPAAKENEAYYEGDYFYSDHSPPDWFDKEAKEYKAGLWNACFDYLIRVGGPAFSMLDYGCGPGWFLDYCTINSMAGAWGIELSQAAIDSGAWVLGKELPIAKNEPVDYMPGIIYLNLVLEHIVNPAEFLTRLVSKHLPPRGRIVIVVPNDLNPLQRRLNYTGFISPVHVNYFTPLTLRGVMEAAGLTVVHESATFPMEIFPLVGINYFGNDALGRRCHRARLRLEKLIGWRIFNLYKRLYNRWGIGRELIFVGEKRMAGRKYKVEFDGVELTAGPGSGE